MVPAQRSDVAKKVVVDGLYGPRCRDSELHVDGVSKHDRGGGEVEATRPEALVFAGSVADLREPMEDYRPGRIVLSNHQP
jgi:hypothetical protein